MALYNEGLFATVGNQTDTLQEKGSFSIKPVRVKFVFLDLEQIKADQPEIYKEYGSDYTLGAILFDNPSNPSPDIQENPQLNNYKFARPLFPNIKNVPLINEIAYIISFPTPSSQDPQFVNLNETGFYYFLPVNLWNSVHHNALPNPLVNNSLPPSQNKTYQQVDAGSSNKVTDQPEEINLGETFQERPNIKNLQPFEGDIIYEGRWGQSIRFGSTVKDRKNDWSSTGNDGDPILIIRNGQYNDNKPAWIPIVENINQDSGSIYFGTTQKIPLNASSTNYDSYSSNPPIAPNEYVSNQIIINSGRVVINAFEDHILLTSKKSVNLNAVDSVNIDTPKAVFQTDKMYLGDKDATEPLLLGNQTEILLNQLLVSLKAFSDICTTLVSTPPGIPLAPLNAVAAQMSSTITQLQSNLPSIKSKDNFTI
jgi:hypothetical protein